MIHIPIRFSSQVGKSISYRVIENDKPYKISNTTSIRTPFSDPTIVHHHDNKEKIIIDSIR